MEVQETALAIAAAIFTAWDSEDKDALCGLHF
jgi:hypothetical protein